jgi:hypothetical protein
MIKNSLLARQGFGAIWAFSRDGRRNAVKMFETYADRRKSGLESVRVPNVAQMQEYLSAIRALDKQYKQLMAR